MSDIVNGRKSNKNPFGVTTKHLIKQQESYIRRVSSPKYLANSQLISLPTLLQHHPFLFGQRVGVLFGGLDGDAYITTHGKSCSFLSAHFDA